MHSLKTALQFFYFTGTLWSCCFLTVFFQALHKWTCLSQKLALSPFFFFYLGFEPGSTFGEQAGAPAAPAPPSVQKHQLFSESQTYCAEDWLHYSSAKDDCQFLNRSDCEWKGRFEKQWWISWNAQHSQQRSRRARAGRQAVFMHTFLPLSPQFSFLGLQGESN